MGGREVEAIHGTRSPPQLALLFFNCKITKHKIHHFNHLNVCNSVAVGKFTGLCNRHRSPVSEYFINPTRNPILTKQALPLPLLPQPLAITPLLYVSMDLPLRDISDQWTHQFVAFCVWLLSLSNNLKTFTHVIAPISTLLLFMAEP